MRHLKAGRKLGMNSSHRLATLRNMVTSLIEHERITTTLTRAKELRRLAEKMVTLAKRGDLHARRLSLRIIREKAAAKKLFEEIAPRFAAIHGGYTRIIKVGRRHGDNAPLALIEFSVARPEEKKKGAEKAKVKAKVKEKDKDKGKEKAGREKPARKVGGEKKEKKPVVKKGTRAQKKPSA